MTAVTNGRAHLITGGFPAGSPSGHDHDYTRLQLLGYLAEREIPASVSNDFNDVAKWLPLSQLMISYVAGPHPNEEQCAVIQEWLEAGGRWLAFHGTAGGRAEPIPSLNARRTIKLPHHAVLGAYFLTHPAIQTIKLEVGDGPPSLLDGLPSTFEVTDEPYFIELQDPGSTHILLTADYGPDCVSPLIGPVYAQDTSLMPDGKSRVLGYTREVGKGGVTYFALGHAHNPAIKAIRAAEMGVPLESLAPLTFRGSWENPTFQTLVRNSIGWGMGE
jgi:uncharacterized protein